MIYLIILENVSKLSKVKDIFNIVVWGITIIGGLYGVINFGITVRASSKERKIKNFQDRVRQIDKVRATSIKMCLDEYKEKHKGVVSSDSSLVAKKEWLLNDHELYDASRVKIHLVDKGEFDPKTIKKRKLKIFPDKKLTYSDLIIKHSESEKSFFNGDVYCTYDIRNIKDKIEIDVFESDYFSFINTAKVLELMNETDQAKKRNKIDVFDFTKRHSAIGISAITIFKNVLKDDKKNNFFAIHQRTSQVMESPNTIHVVPAGTYSPMVLIEELSGKKDESTDFSFDLRNTIYREFLEEIWQTKHMHELGSIKLLKENPRYYILKYFTDIYYLGLGLEPYNTKTEILFALVFNMEGFDDKEIDYRIDNIEETISEDLKNEIRNEFKILFKKDFQFEDFKKFLSEDSKDDENSLFIEGDIRLESLTKGVLEQYYSDINSTAAAKEIFRKVYHVFDQLIEKK